MIQKGQLLQDIRKGLAVSENLLRSGSGLNLQDVNVHAEDFIAGLLNVLFEWKLVNTNQTKSNYPCIDLIDETERLGVQVTAERGAGKINETLKCLHKHNLSNSINRFKIFTLLTKQTSYKVTVSCAKIQFDWTRDVLDFSHAVSTAARISDLNHLRRVHQFVVDNNPSLFPEYNFYQPFLYIPETDAAVAWLSFSSRSTTLTGRDAELAALTTFLSSETTFSWLLLTGGAGSGKSRLALELCKQVEADWHVGFLSRSSHPFDWSKFEPQRKTLIVVDYVAGRAREVSDMVLMLARKSRSFALQVRILLVERSSHSWWLTFSRAESLSESAELLSLQHSEAIELRKLSIEAILHLATDVFHEKGERWSMATAGLFLLELFRFDPECRPLFAMILAQHFGSTESIDNSGLLKRVLEKESSRRNQMISNSEALKKLENLMFVATFTCGLAVENVFSDSMRDHGVTNLLPQISDLDQKSYSALVGATEDGESFPGLQPDILGELFVLDRISETGASGVIATKLRDLAWDLQSRECSVFCIRCISDFPDHPGIHKLVDLPHEQPLSRGEWASMIADLAGNPDTSDTTIAHELYMKMLALAQHLPDEISLQESIARADYNMGCTSMVRGDSAKSIEKFDSTLRRVGSNSAIGTMALLNRGTFAVGDEAFQMWTAVIDSQFASNEMRACAFNNRANIYFDRGEHENSIRDRSSVLALPKTSADRRFVALFRRSESYSAIANESAALADLNAILETADIKTRDKLCAAIERAIINFRSDAKSAARTDLEKALDDILLDNSAEATDIAVLVKSEQARRAGRLNDSANHLSNAIDLPKAGGSKDIRYWMIKVLLVDEDAPNSDEVENALGSLRAANRGLANRMRIAFSGRM